MQRFKQTNQSILNTLKTMTNKKFSFLLSAVLLITSLLIISCNKSEEVTTPTTVNKQDVTFSFANKSFQGAKGMQKAIATSKTDAKYVVVTIEDASGTQVYGAKKLALYDFNGSFVSEPISLDVAAGAYKLTQFMVLDVNDVVIYVTPVQGSTLAGLVITPLPISFTVTKDQVTKVVPEVVDASCCSSTEFGYASFDFNIINVVCSRVAVEIYNSTTANWEFADAAITVTDGGSTTLYNGNITATTAAIVVKDGYANYTLTASKSGYDSKSVTLTNAELKAYCNTPLIFLLEKGCQCNQETLTDIDGNVYKTVTIGTQTWMAENLKVTHYRNGDPIKYVTDNAEWALNYNDFNGFSAYCWYNNDIANKDVYGALYNGYTVFDSRNIAIQGWHVPTADEWRTLINYLGGYNSAGGKLKETGTLHWASPNDDATNETCFSALPTGGRGKADGVFGNINLAGYYWSSTEETQSGYPNMWVCGILTDWANNSITDPNVGVWFCQKGYGNAIRLIKD